MLYTKHTALTDATETTLFTVPTGYHVIIYYVFIANHAGSTQNASMHFAKADGSERIDIFEDTGLASGSKEVLSAGGGPLFVLHEGEVVKVQAGSVSSDMQFLVTFDLLEMSPSLINFV
jgi:hypothetical protein